MQVKYDRKLLIAIGRSRKASQWQNKEMLWSEFLDKLATTTRTRETVAEYATMPKGERDTIKDVGGFVGGYLKNGRRNNASVVNRCMLCLDADNADPGLMDDLDMTFINAYALYSTHSHTPEKMRLRLIIPLTRTVTPDEYAAVSRRVADDLGLSRFDPTTFEPARLMYWPSTPEDGEFFFHCEDAPFLDPDEVLKTYADWRDASLWPTTQPVEERIRHTTGKQEDPTEKRGIIGAFCRAHTITDVLTHILPDRYTPTEQDDRYTFIGGSTTGGLVVYDDKYAFSHHATDPAGGKLCNAFDLVRWHLFTPGGTAPDGSLVGNEASSMSAMRAYAAADEATRIQLAEERLRQADEDFAEEPTEPAIPDDASEPASSEWQSKLAYDKMGNLKNTLTNLLLIVQNDPQLKGVVFNQLSDGMEIRDDIAPVPWKHPSKFWRDADDKQIISYIETRYGAFSNRNYDIAIGKVTDDRSYHPIRDYLSALPEWDQTPRIETLLIDYLGAPDNRYVRAVTRKTLCAAVKRVLQPGVKFDKALETPADENMFRQLRLNQWVKQSIRWMPMDKWDECGGVVDPYQLEGRACYAGLDLSSTSDLTTLVLVFPPRDENEAYMVLPFFWLPEDTLALRVRRDHVMYDQWEQQGFIQTTEGNVVHYGFIEKFICELGERYNIREIAYDRWNATMMVQALEDDGFTMIPFGQGFRDMSPPTKELMRIVLEHRLNHGGHPVLRWNFDNAYVRTDPAGNLKLDKEKSTEKIDGAVALVMALDRAMKNQSSGDSVYNERGLLLL